MTDTGRVAEEAVLGSVLINPLSFFELAFLKSTDFHVHRHQWVWDAFTRLSDRHAEIDIVTVSDELRERLADAGGAAFLTNLTLNVPSSLNAESYARIVQENSMRRQLRGIASSLANDSVNIRKDPREAIVEARTRIDAVQDLSEHKLISFGQLLGDTFTTVQERAKDPKEVWGFRTGLPTFDRQTGGVQQSELLYVAGAPAVGKTWLELGWGVEFGRQAPGVWVSLEMKRTAVGRRILSGISGVSTRAMKSGFLNEGDWPRLTRAVGDFADLPILFDDTAYDTHRLRSMLVWAKQEKGIRWFIVDYALLLLDQGRDEIEQSKVISANMKRIVNDLDLAGVVIHSVVKLGMNEHDEPSMADQRGSGQAIHDADVQLFLTKVSKNSGFSEEDQKRMATLWVSKGRELEQSRFSINLTRRGTSPFWVEVDTKHPEEPPQYWDER